jgi:hypothetical protein
MRSAHFACICLLLANSFALAQNPVPFINQPLVPMTTAPGGPGFTLTVNGTEFVSGAVVNWNGTALATSFVTGSQVTATVPAADIATAGTVSVTVTNPPPGGGVSNVVYFEVSSPVSTLSFSTFYSYSPGQAEELGNDMVAADFNGDGKLDLALLSDVLSAIVIQLGNGDGTYQEPPVYTGTGTAPRGLVAADFNGDGKLDVVVGSLDDNTGSIFLGNGDGTFQAAKTFAAGQAGTFWVAAGDFNRDGKLDLALAIQNSGVSILLGNGDGTFQAPTNYIPQFSGVCTVNGMALGDFNGDGKLDIAYLCNTSGNQPQLFVMLGNGDGTFQFTSSVPLQAPFSQYVLAADFNGDRKLDLATVGGAGSGSDLTILLGNGDGTFQAPVTYGAQDLFGEVVAGDFNADGKLDIAETVTEGGNQGGLVLFLGNGDGTFQNLTQFNLMSDELLGCLECPNLGLVTVSLI